MNMKKILFVATIVGAMGIGAMIGPMVGFAQTDVQRPFQQFQNLQGNNWQPMGARMGQYFSGAMRDDVAEALGITVDDLYEARTSGKSLEEIAKEKGVETEDLLKLLIEAKQEQLDELVKDGVLTEEQKEYILSNMEERMEGNISRTECGPGMGQGFRGQGRFNQDSNFQPGQGRGFGGGPRWSTNNE